jgi:hypothetical protein
MLVARLLLARLLPDRPFADRPEADKELDEEGCHDDTHDQERQIWKEPHIFSLEILILQPETGFYLTAAQASAGE